MPAQETPPPGPCAQPCCPELLYGKPYTTASCNDFLPPCPPPPRKGIMTWGDYCGRTQAHCLEDAWAKMNNRFYFNGITAHGYQQPIREGINPSRCFRDKNAGHPELEQFLPRKNDPNPDFGKLAEDFRSIDIYSGLVDGRNYGRYNRLYQQAHRHMRNPLGTEVRFCIPMCNSMNYGWWQRDLTELNQNRWFSPRVRYPQVRGEITRFVDDMVIHDPNFIMF